MSLHIAHQLADSPSSHQTSEAPASPPLSSYSTYRPPGFQPSCTHLTMTRIYDPNFDREHLIKHAMENDHPVNYDLLGLSFSEQISPSPRGPERRSDKFAFLKEITPDQLRTYTPQQIATILEQRQHLLDVVRREYEGQRSFYFPSHDGQHVIKLPPGFDYPRDRKPWVPEENDECQVKYCHQCRPTCEPRTYLSLDGVLHGDVSPSAATGFGFHRMGTRPIMDAETMRHIGLKAVPWPKAKHATLPSSLTSESSNWSISDLFEDIPPDATRVEFESSPSDDNPSIGSITSPFSRRHGFNNYMRPPWSPPPTPKGWVGVRWNKEGVPSFEHQPFICDGRSPTSLKINKQTHDQVLSSIDGLIIEPPRDDSEDMDLQSAKPPPPSPTTTFIRACLTPLPPPTHGEEKAIRDTASTMMVEESEGCFHREPLDVGDGVAVLEESVDLGVPDIVSQV
ncbi:hypothetical protein F4809DRAFT_637150 [Biscogniauxia mediterranea]|nr:hypothetical protein F4809DRAFT_637150 [Biscogniauxia mediterranea]